jgi:hypothetical protein
MSLSSLPCSTRKQLTANKRGNILKFLTHEDVASRLSRVDAHSVIRDDGTEMFIPHLNLIQLHYLKSFCVT